MIKLFGIPNCDSVKKARSFLESIDASYDFIDFKKYTPTAHDLKRWSEVFGGLPVNAKGITYKKNKDTFDGLSDEEKISFLQAHTSMIKRPILEVNGVILAFGFNEDEYRTFFR